MKTNRTSALAREPRGSDRRRSPRSRVYLCGFVRGGPKQADVPCCIVDISDTGVRAVLVHGGQASQLAADLPAEVILTMHREQVEVTAEVRWQRRDQIGLHFTSGFRPIDNPGFPQHDAWPFRDFTVSGLRVGEEDEVRH